MFLLMHVVLAALVAISAMAAAEKTLCSSFGSGSPLINLSDEYIVLSNGYVCAVLNSKNAAVTELRGDFSGSYSYGHNSLSGAGIVLEREDGSGHIYSSADSAAKVLLSKNDAEEGVLQFDVRDSETSPYAAETWTLSIQKGARFLQFDVKGQVASISPPSGKCVRRVTNMLPTSLYALFSRGVVQMKDAASKYYMSKDSLPRFYALGGSGGDLNTAGNVSLSIERTMEVKGQETILFSNNKGPVWSGLHEVLLGSFKDRPREKEVENAWVNGWTYVMEKPLPSSAEWSSSSKLYPNNFDFPTFTVPVGANLPDADIQAMLTGIYASPVGCLNTHDDEVQQGYHVAQIATTPHHPDTGYSGTYNYFDPDNYIGTAALLYSGDEYLQEQVKLVIERSGSFINELGQLPHHFEGVTPTYQALSGETQTGPNVFWVLAALNYAKTTGDLQWLSTYMPILRNASAFLFDMIDPELGLAKAPGSLMIDVFIRGNFTTDSNSMLVGYFREFADAEESLGNSTGASYLRTLASTISTAVDNHLWSQSQSMGQDHYITQLNADKTTTRDFVDFDSNTIALAYGIPQSLDRASKLMARIDSNPCAHGRATWVSEVYYGVNDTTNGNIGDSNCSMARIGWFDALARKRYGDLDTFDNKIINPLISDVNRWTWIHERYACDGSPQQFRTAFYFEYPSATAMLIRQIRYGVEVGYLTVTISPFGPKKFNYHVGNVNVDYDSEQGQVSVSVPAKSQQSYNGVNWAERTYVIAGMAAEASFQVTTGAGCSFSKSIQATSDASGSLSVQGLPVGVGCVVSFSKL